MYKIKTDILRTSNNSFSDKVLVGFDHLQLNTSTNPTLLEIFTSAISLPLTASIVIAVLIWFLSSTYDILEET